MQPWILTPQILHYSYDSNKKSFLLQSDIYENWVVFSAEKGSFEFSIASETGIAKCGDFVFCPPGISFKREVCEPMRFHFFTLKWNEISNDSVSLKNLIPVGKVEISDFVRVNSFYNLMEKANSRNDFFSIQWKNILFRDIWFLICSEKNNSLSDDEKFPESVFFLSENAGKSGIISEAAERVGLTSVQFMRRFKKRMGITPMEYITELRMKKVCEYLKNSDSTLNEIAEYCGYQNEYYLSKAFKKYKGMSPSVYRNFKL